MIQPNLKKTLYELQKGDVVVKDSMKKMVLVSIQGVYLLSSGDQFDRAEDWYTLQQLERMNYTVQNPNPEEICSCCGKEK